MSRQLFIRYLKTQSRTDPFRFYVYAYLRSKDSITGKSGTPYYIGKGTANRAWDTHGKVPVPKDKSNIVIILHELTELWAFAVERRIISWYGRKDNCTGILLNLTDGGDGVSGYNHREESKQKISESISGENHHMFGKNHREESKQKISESLLGISHSNERKRNTSKAMCGKKKSENHKRNLGESIRCKIPIRCIETGSLFIGAAYACDWLVSTGIPKANSGHISGCCSGTRKTAYGYTWEFVVYS